MDTIRTTIYLSETDRHALAQLQACYGVSTLIHAPDNSASFFLRGLWIKDNILCRIV